MSRAWRALLLGAALMCLEAMWLGAWLRWLAAMAGDLKLAGPGTLVGLGLSALLLTRLLLAVNIDLGLARLVSLAGALLALLIAARRTLYPALAWPLLELNWLRQLGLELAASPGDFNSAGMLLATVAWLWWRGSRFGSLPLTPQRARRAVGMALGALALLGLLAATTRPVALVPWVYGALAAGLVLLALARLDEASRAYGGSAVDFGPAWLSMVLGATAAVLGGVALLASMISEQAAADLARALEPLPTVLKRLALMGLAVLATWLGYLAEWLALRMSAFFDMQRFMDLLAQQAPAEGEQDLAGAAEAAVGGGTPMWLENGLRILFLVLAVWLLARILSRAMRRYMDGRDNRGVTGEVAGGMAAGRLIEDLSAALRGLAVGAGATLRRLGRRGGVRGLYIQLLQLMAARRQGRREAQTPDEYRPVPESSLPEAAAEIAELTDAYVAVRYGEREPDAEALARLKRAWREIRRAAGG